MLLLLHAGWYCISAICLGWFSQLVFTAMMLAIWALHNLTIDSLIGMVIAAPIGGLSLGW